MQEAERVENVEFYQRNPLHFVHLRHYLVDILIAEQLLEASFDQLAELVLDAAVLLALPALKLPHKDRVLLLDLDGVVVADPEELGEELDGPHLEFVALVDEVDVDGSLGALAPVDQVLEERLVQLYLLLVAPEEADLYHLVGHRQHLQSHLLVFLQQGFYL